MQMTNLEALRALEPKVADGTWGPEGNESAMLEWVAWPLQNLSWGEARSAYNGSMDAALPLLKAMLPGWLLALRETIDGTHVSLELPLGIKVVEVVGVHNEEKSRLLLLAIIRALIWCAENEGDSNDFWETEGNFYGSMGG